MGSPRETEKPREVELQRYLESQRELAARLLEADTLDQVAPRFLAIVGELLRWEAGALWEVGESADTYYCVGGRTGVGIRRPAPEHAGQRFEQFRVGLHHLCWRVRERQEVDQVHEFLVGIGARIVHAPQQDAYAPGYYSVLFEDPDGVRLEVNHVPGRGVFDAGGRVYGSLD